MRQTSEAPFLGRQEELTRMGDWLDRAAGGEPRIVVVDGTAGIGKTSLIRRFLADRARGCRVVTASGEELERELAYGLTTQLLHHLSGTARAPLHDEAHDTSPGTAAPDPISVGAVVLDALGRFQDNHPVVLVIDDIHWADTPSLHALTFVLRRLRVDRVLTVLATRDPADPRLPQGLHRLLHDDTTLRLTLEGLGVPELTALNSALGPAPLPRRTLVALRDHTLGNPLHVKALLQQFPADVLGADTVLPAPRRYERIIAERLAACDPGSRRLVQAASVLGMSSPLHLAAEVGTVLEPLTALTRAMTRELLDEGPAGAPPQVVFPHPLLRAAVYRGLEPAERSHLHRVAAGLTTDPWTALRHRVHAAAGPDEQLARELDVFASRQSGKGAWSAAASASMAAARLSAEPGRQARRLLRGVEYLLLAGDVSQAAELEQTVRGMAPDAEQHYVLGHLALTTGRLDEARGELAACWDTCDATTGSETLRKAAEQMAWLCLIQGDAPRIIHWAERGLALPPGERSSFLRDSLAIGLAVSGDHAHGMRSLAHLPDTGPRGTPEQLDGLLARGMLRLWNGQLSEARRDLKDAFDSHRRGGLPYAALVALGFLTDAEYRAGQWDEAIAHGTHAVSLAEDTDQMSILAVVHAVTAYPLACRGDLRAAEAHARSAADHARVLGDVNDSAFAATALALVHTARGDHDKVIEELSPLLRPETGHRYGIEEPGLVAWRPLLAEALARTGRTGGAQAVLAPYERRAAERNRPLEQAAAARCRGLLEEARGHSAAAGRAFRDGFEHCARGESCWEESLLRLSYGAFLRRSGRRKDAAAELEAAHETFHRLRATPYLERCDRELTACGSVTARPRSARHPVLTAQELTVARLAARGMTNRQIARELLLSVKTIEYHLGNCYTKLGITSRVGLADKLARNA
ncbi:helix-turn-helix transcriptional regulator [Streptomyces caelestis]|uniref:helix-turn-helix transcriptional regulator n=1 Tax=Streptomyces caelestis TaxID=36816 RepID=UPI0036660081